MIMAVMMIMPRASYKSFVWQEGRGLVILTTLGSLWD